MFMFHLSLFKQLNSFCCDKFIQLLTSKKNRLNIGNNVNRKLMKAAQTDCLFDSFCCAHIFFWISLDEPLRASCNQEKVMMRSVVR